MLEKQSLSRRLSASIDSLSSKQLRAYCQFEIVNRKDPAGDESSGSSEFDAGENSTYTYKLPLIASNRHTAPTFSHWWSLSRYSIDMIEYQGKIYTFYVYCHVYFLWSASSAGQKCAYIYISTTRRRVYYGSTASSQTNTPSVTPAL